MWRLQLQRAAVLLLAWLSKTYRLCDSKTWGACHLSRWDFGKKQNIRMNSFMVLEMLPMVSSALLSVAS